MAIGLSGLCLVHCLATAVMLGLLSAAGGMLGRRWIHEVGLGLAMILGGIALGRGVIEHGFMMPSAVGGLGLGVMAGALTMPHDGTRRFTPWSASRFWRSATGSTIIAAD